MENKVSTQESRLVNSVVQQVLPGARVMLFGSRVQGTHRPASDLDVAIDDGKPLTLETLSQLRLAFSESSLPYFVDIVDWCSASDDFRQAVAQQLEETVEILHQ